MNESRSFISSSFILTDEGGIRRERRSLEGFDTWTLRTTFWARRSNDLTVSQAKVTDTHGSSHAVRLYALKPTLFIEVHVAKFRLLDHFGVESTL